jgi:hypothetical protein
MGIGIIGAIPVSFRFGNSHRDTEEEIQRNQEKFIAHAPADFFDFYTEHYRMGTWKTKLREYLYYDIKPELLIPNFKDFFLDFHEIIGVEKYDLEGSEKFNEDYDAIVASNDMNKFMAYFNDDTGYAPVEISEFEALYITEARGLLVYQGSYKALLEEWSTLKHLERLLWGAMEHPLAKVMRIGMSK